MEKGAESESARGWNVSGAASYSSHVACGSQTRMFGESGFCFWPPTLFALFGLPATNRLKIAQTEVATSLLPHPHQQRRRQRTFPSRSTNRFTIFFIFISCVPSVALRCSDDIVVVAAAQQRCRFSAPHQQGVHFLRPEIGIKWVYRITRHCRTQIY